MTNVHALGSADMITRAKEGLIEGSNREVADLIAVTILTSHSDQTLREELNFSQSVDEAVLALATLAKQNGADGVVCSALEVPKIKAKLGQDFLTVTPGIRLLDTNADDQQRIATPELAKANGADYLVIGRSITESENPRQQYLKVWEAVNRDI
jgi:orotidine-5'-phosphate decarboxylase